MPGQVVPAAPVAVDQPVVADVSPTAAEAAPAPPAAGDGGLQTALAAVGAIALGALGGIARYRGLFAQAGAWASQWRMKLRTRPSSWFGRQGARGLALLRLTLGMLRMW
jgi:hypothetical protein